LKDLNKVLGNGQWAMGNGQWKLDIENLQRFSGKWTTLFLSHAKAQSKKY
jgi:hypothetical protein